MDASRVASAHANGTTLFAVAAGDPAKQLDESTLSHVFSCRSCSATVREIRSGLSAIATDPEPNALPTLREPVDDESPRSRRMVIKLIAIGALLAGALLWMRAFAAGLH
ncbi:MAG: hypothetical protein EXS13_01425 [Planctomycetes bacterium]|nr:hypothetical protein [Planctomycetota bacterium]